LVSDSKHEAPNRHCGLDPQSYPSNEPNGEDKIPDQVRNDDEPSEANGEGEEEADTMSYT
jgi:hypothetical protein